jgi:hypothetical protein
MPTVVVGVASNGDDGQVAVDTSTLSTGVSCTIGNYGGAAQRMGVFRFLNLVVPVGAIVTSAYITFIRTGAGTSVATTISAVDEDSSAMPATFAQWQTDHGLHTTATAAWTIPAGGAAGDSLVSADFASVAQEIISRPGWVSGANALHIHIDDNGSGSNTQGFVAQYDHATYTEPTLTLTYTTGTPSALRSRRLGVLGLGG